MASKFHNMLARVILAVAERAKRDHGTETVSLAGGCFLNKRLLLGTERLLGRNGFTVLRTEAYSPNDESLSLGQIAFALARLRRRGK
jgi:hydrogenase maturation protein HypF